MQDAAYQHLTQLIKEVSIPLQPEKNDYSELLKQIGDARFVLLGEATHGTHEFYQARMEISEQLIREKGFMAIAIEGDWPDVYKINRYLKGAFDKENIQDALSEFKRFPTWMWRNHTMLPFLQRLREYNDALGNGAVVPRLDRGIQDKNKIGMYGLDLYSLYPSIHAVITYLANIDHDAAMRASKRYACFDHPNIDEQTYGYLTTAGIKKKCIQEVVEELIELQTHAIDYVKKDNESEDEYFYATQNARVVKNAEHYYRSMFEDHVSSWNVRDTHMVETLGILSDHLEKRFARPAKIIVWAHNSHVGDARATEMGDRGEINLGQLVREQHSETHIVGFSTYTGTVTAADEWNDPPDCKEVNEGIASSCEKLFHDVQQNNFMLNLHEKNINHFLQLPRLQRAIGVIYRPDTERQSHYFFTRLPYQFDTLIHFDKTTALKPLD